MSSESSEASAEFVASFVCLGVLCAGLCAWSCEQALRFWLLSPRVGGGFGVQKLFTSLLGVACALRCALFFASPLTAVGRRFFAGPQSARRDAPAFAVLADAGELLFFCALSLLALFWAEVSFAASARRRVFARCVQPLFLGVLGVGALAQGALWAAEFLLPPAAFRAVNFADNALFIALYLFCGAGTVAFGAAVFARVRSNPVRSPGRAKKLREILCVTVACCVFLAFHTLTATINLLPGVTIDLHHIGFALLAVLTLAFELLPAALLLYVLRFKPLPPDNSSSRGGGGGVVVNNSTSLPLAAGTAVVASQPPSTPVATSSTHLLAAASAAVSPTTEYRASLLGSSPYYRR